LQNVNVGGATYKTIRYKKEDCKSQQYCEGLLLTVSPSKTTEDANTLLISLREGSSVNGDTPAEWSGVKKFFLKDVRNAKP
jgi:hypothetical protein